MDATEEQKPLDLVTERLAAKFPQLRRDMIVAAVREAEAGMLAAPIRDFVPVLVEKQARDWLSARLSPGYTTPAAGSPCSVPGRAGAKSSNGSGRATPSG